MSEACAKVPVRIYLLVRQMRRGGKFWENWWSVIVMKEPGFGPEDFTPLAVEATCDETGHTRRYDFGLERVDPEACIVVAKPFQIPFSKFWPFERTLMGCGWEQCEAPTR
jgi:hypothetical protein